MLTLTFCSTFAFPALAFDLLTLDFFKPLISLVTQQADWHHYKLMNNNLKWVLYTARQLPHFSRKLDLTFSKTTFSSFSTNFPLLFRSFHFQIMTLPQNLKKFSKKAAAKRQELYFPITKFTSLPSFAPIFFFFSSGTTKEMFFL